MDVTSDSDGSVLAFSGPATIRQAQEAWSGLRAAVDAGAPIRLDLSGVSETDVIFVQLVEAVRIAAAAHGGEVRLSAPADGALLDVLTRGGFLTDADAARLDFWTHTGTVQ